MHVCIINKLHVTSMRIYHTIPPTSISTDLITYYIQYMVLMKSDSKFISILFHYNV